MSKLSIILVSHNRPEMLREAIDSILAQTMPDWELIITDQDSPRRTETWAVCEEAAHDPRVKLIRNAENIDNIAAVWNTALEQATGDYWCTLDDDNRKQPTFAEKLCGLLDAHPEYIAAVCGMNHFGGDHQGPHMPLSENLPNLPVANFIDSGEIVYRRRTLDEIGWMDERMISQEDWDYVLRTYRHYGAGAFGWVREALADYRWHADKRMNRSAELNMYECAKIIQRKEATRALRVQMVTPEHESITTSQHQVYAGIMDGLRGVPFAEIVEDAPDLILCPGPVWLYEVDRLRELRGTAPTMALLMEDPQGTPYNMRRANEFDWIVSNDAAAAAFYRSAFHQPEQVYQWNALSLTDEVLAYCRENAPEKVYDLCFIGYPYASRARFIHRLRALLPQVSFVLLGNTWDMQRVAGPTMTFPTLPALETAQIGLQSRIVLCKHRTREDTFPMMLPASVNRGYSEVAYRAAVMIDSDRAEHSFPDGAVTWYTDVDDAAEKATSLLAATGEARDSLCALASEYTYTARLTRLLNAWRSPRWNVSIP
jgi:hypothetical protein